MRRQLYGIVMIGVLSLVSFGVMAYYLAGKNPKIALHEKLSANHAVEVLAYEVKPFDAARRRRVHAVQLRPTGPRPEGLHDDEEWAFHLALAIDETLMKGKQSGRAPYDELEIVLGDASARTYARHGLVFRKRLQETLPALSASLEGALGEGTRTRLVVDGDRFGVEVEPGRKPAPEAPDAGVSDGELPAAGDATPPLTPRAVAEAVYERSRQYAFVVVAGLTDAPIRFELGDIVKPRRRSR